MRSPRSTYPLGVWRLVRFYCPRRRRRRRRRRRALQTNSSSRSIHVYTVCAARSHELNKEKRTAAAAVVGRKRQGASSRER